jgi:hypothetical protein
MIANTASRILSVCMFTALHLTSSNFNSIGLVGRSVGRSVGRLVGWLVGLFVCTCICSVYESCLKTEVFGTSGLTHNYVCLIKVLVEIITVCHLVARTLSEAVVCGIFPT